MKRLILLCIAALTSAVLAAGEHDLLWDYTSGPPKDNPDRGLSYSGTVNDAEGVKNGLKGIKLNSSGWCSFTKAPVAGRLKLTFGPRSGMNPASIEVHASANEHSRTAELVGSTCEVTALRTQTIDLTAEQNVIYITRLLNMETVLQKIEFTEGFAGEPAPCEEPEDSAKVAEARVKTLESLSAETKAFLQALREANGKGDTTIYLKNGIYDLRDLTLTAIEANHIRIIGESMEGVIIRNAPDYRRESIDKSATLRIAPGVEWTFLQNLTIENALDYYKDDNGRAVALWDQGTKTVCKRVRLMSHQDTYYSDMSDGLKYFEDCEIHGTVDFICGNGNVYFKNTLLYCKRRSKDGSGTDALTASNAGINDRGYVFESCRVKSECPVVSLGRSWNDHPKCVFLNTVLDYSAGYFELTNKDIQRWTMKGMMVLPELFGEYHTTDVQGNVVSPEKNEVVFTYRGQEKAMNTILTKEEAKQFTMEYVLGEWKIEDGKL